MDWGTGIIERRDDAASGSSGTVEYVVAGDFAPSRRQVEAIRDDARVFYGDVIEEWPTADHVLCNLECVFTDRTERLNKDGPHLVQPSSEWAGVERLPVDIYCLANNHIMDAGAGGLEDTRKLIEKSGKSACGAGLHDTHRAPLFLQDKGVRIAIINAAEAEEAGVNEAGAGAQVLDAALLRRMGEIRQDADLLLVIMHAGREHIPCPPPYIRKQYRDLIESGANLVIGHHPHVPQGIECYRNGIILYSLGNLIMDDKNRAYRDEGMSVRVFMDASGVRRLEIRPHCIREGGIRLMREAENRSFLERLKKLSGYCSDNQSSAALWDAYADYWMAHEMPAELAGSAALLVDGPQLIQSAVRVMSETNRPGGWYRMGARMLPFLASRMVYSKESVQGEGPPPPCVKRGAERLRNRMMTRAHRDLYIHAMNRIIQHEAGQAEQWAVDFVDAWFRRSI